MQHARTARVRTHFGLTLTTALLVMAGGCKKEQPPAPEPPAAAQTQSQTKAEDQGSCPDATKLTVNSTNGAYPKEAPIDWSTIKKAVAYVRGSYGVSSAHIYLGNFEIPDLSWRDLTKHKLSDGQGMVNLTVIRQVPKEKRVPLVSGPYDANKAQGQAERVASAGIVVAGGTTVTLRSGKIEGEMEITRVSSTEVCGKLSLKDPWSSISGEFRAPTR